MGSGAYTAPADWYFPTQADGSVQPNGVIYLQHGFLGDSRIFGARRPTRCIVRPNSVVVVPTLPSVPSITDPEVYSMSATTQRAVADLFAGDRVALSESAASVRLLSVSCRTTTSAGHPVRWRAGCRGGDTASRMGPLTGICWVW